MVAYISSAFRKGAASTGGSLIPPVMGAAAFIMSEYTGVEYVDIAFAAVIPVLLHYLPIYLQVHLRADRLGLRGIDAGDRAVCLLIRQPAKALGRDVEGGVEFCRKDLETDPAGQFDDFVVVEEFLESGNPLIHDILVIAGDRFGIGDGGALFCGE